MQKTQLMNNQQYDLFPLLFCIDAKMSNFSIFYIAMVFSTILLS